MDFYIDIESRKQELLEKMRSNDYSFSVDDRFIIELDPEIRKESFRLLASSRDLWTESATDYFWNIVQSEDIDYLPENTLYYYCLSCIDKGNLEDVEEILSYIDKTQEIHDYLVEKLKNPNYVIEKNFGSFVAEAIIEVGRYELFDSLRRGYYGRPVFDNATLKKVLENYPYAFKDLCLDLDDKVVEEVRSNYQNLNVYELFGKFSENKEEIFPILKSKLFSSDVKLKYSLDRTISIEDFYILLTDPEKEIFKKKMIFLDISWYFRHASISEMQDNISEITESMRYNNIDINQYNQYKSILLSSREVMDSFLERNKLFFMLDSPLFDEYVPKIVDLISSKKLNLIVGIPLEHTKTLCLKYPEILKAALKGDAFSSQVFPMLMKNEELAQRISEELIQHNGVIGIPSLTLSQAKKLIGMGNLGLVLKNIQNITADSSKFIDFRKDPVLLTDEECDKLIECLKDSLDFQNMVLQVANTLIFSNPSIFKFYLHSNSIMLEQIVDYINHHEELERFYTDEFYHEIKTYYAAKFGLNIENLDRLESTFGPTIIKYFDNENICKIVKLDKDKLDKLIQLFPKVNYDMSNLENMYDSLKQYAFGREHPEIINIFAHIKHSIEDNTSEFLNDLEELVSVIDDKFYKYYAKKDQALVEACKNSPIQFLKDLVIQMRSTDPETKENALRTLHKITDYYIASKREEYRKSYNMVEELNLPYKLDEKDTEKNLIIYAFQTSYYTLDNMTNPETILDFALLELVKNGMDESLARNTLDFYLQKRTFPEEKLVDIKKNIRFVIPVLKKVINDRVEKEYLNYYTQNLDSKGKIKRNYYVPASEIDMYQLLTSIRIDSIEKNLLEDNPTSNKVYQSLQATMKKYKLHAMPSCFKDLLESEHVQISSDLTNISSFISYYHQVHETERKRLESQGKDSSNIILSATNVLLNASVLSGVSSVYSQLLGSEDAKLIKANPGPNVAITKTAGDARLKEAVSWTIKNFERMEVTVPSFSETVDFSNNRSMRVVVGNFTHPSNITHGERTGACMRIGGVGETLFNFCLDDINGFHIRFEDDKTGEYISRVSGFRNGNTVFLNELRNSCNKSLYSDEDIIEACKKIGESLIYKSKDSTCPIQNVVVARAYATANLEAINLGITDNKKGLKRFYSDIQSSGIVLASTATPYATINMDKTSVPTYSPAREKTYIGEDISQLLDRMNRVHSVKEVLSGSDYQYIEPLVFDNEIVYGFVNQDWYVCMDSMGNIFEEIIPIDKRAEEELEAARKIVEQYVPKKQEEDTYQM